MCRSHLRTPPFGRYILELTCSRSYQRHALTQYRTSVDVIIEFLDDSAYKELLGCIQGSATQPSRYLDSKDNRKRICKTFQVLDAPLFILALRFKAALNYAAWSSERGGVSLPLDLFGD